jgi:hypothetical protein
MFGMLDHQARTSFAREHAQELRDSAGAYRRQKDARNQEAGRRKPTRSGSAVVVPHAAALRKHAL